MKILGPFAYLTLNYGVLILLRDCFYIVTLNTKATLKYLIYNEVPFLYSDPLDGLTTDTLHQFLAKNQNIRFGYNDGVEVTFDHSAWNNSVFVKVGGISCKFLLTKRSQSNRYQESLQEVFKDKLTVNGKYSA